MSAGHTPNGLQMQQVFARHFPVCVLKGYTFFGEGCFPSHPRCGCCHLHLPYRGRFLGKNGPSTSAWLFGAPAPAELRLGLEHVPVSPWGLNNGVSGTAGAPCLQARRQKAAVSPLLKPESGTKTRPRPNRSRAPSRYAHGSRSETGSRFFTSKNGGKKGDEAMKWLVLLFTRLRR